MKLTEEVIKLSEMDWDYLKVLEIKAKRKYEEALRVGSRKIDTFWVILKAIRLAKRLKIRLEAN